MTKVGHSLRGGPGAKPGTLVLRSGYVGINAASPTLEGMGTVGVAEIAIARSPQGVYAFVPRPMPVSCVGVAVLEAEPARCDAGGVVHPRVTSIYGDLFSVDPQISMRGLVDYGALEEEELLMTLRALAA